MSLLNQHILLQQAKLTLKLTLATIKHEIWTEKKNENEKCKGKLIKESQMVKCATAVDLQQLKVKDTK